MSDHRSIEFRGTTVVRPSGFWTPAVHALFDHLHAAGFDGAPRAVSHDDEREVVSFIPGETVGEHYLHPWTGDDQLASVARLIRRYHDAAAGFVPAVGARWCETSIPTTGTLVCHNDLYRGNVVFRDGQAVGLIDFDFAHPADPVRDLAVAAWHWIPLSDRWPTDVATDRWPERLRLFADAYHLGEAERRAMVGYLRDFLITVLARARSTSTGVERAERDLSVLQHQERALAHRLCL